MAALFVAATIFKGRFAELVWVEAFAEAGLVGGLADWFAVVALFRRPLHLPFPHTALIPRNKDRIGRELGAFVDGNFLTPANIAARLEGVDLAGRGARWLARPANAVAVAAVLRELITRLAASFDDREIEQLMARAARERLETLDVLSLTEHAVSFLTAEDRLRPVIDQLLETLARWLDQNRATLKSRFGSRSRLTPKWVDGYVVDRFVDAIIDLVDEVSAAPRHEVRQSFERGVQGFAERLRTDPELALQIEGIKADLIDRLDLDRLAGGLWGELKRRLLDPAIGEAKLAASVRRAASQLRNDPELLDRLNQGALALVEAGLSRFRRQFSSLIADVVKRWDANQVVTNIELAVGPDLQFIRVNGTLVGGAAGVLIHAILVLAMP